MLNKSRIEHYHFATPPKGGYYHASKQMPLRLRPTILAVARSSTIPLLFDLRTKRVFRSGSSGGFPPALIPDGDSFKHLAFGAVVLRERDPLRAWETEFKVRHPLQ